MLLISAPRATPPGSCGARPARSHLRQTVTAFVIAMLFVSACSDPEPSDTTTVSAPESTTSQVPSTAVQSIPPPTTAAPGTDIEALLIPADAAPTGTELTFEHGDDAVLQPVQASAPDAQKAIRDGWVSTRLRIFFNPDMLAALESAELGAYSTNFATPGHWSVGSWVSQYQDAAAAQRALALMVREFGSVWQLTRGDDPGLGEESAAFHGATELANGTPTTIYAWRAGPYVLELIAHGSVEAGASELHDIAAGMAARIPASTTESPGRVAP